MKYVFKPKTEYEKFCQKILNTLVENSTAVFICGGTARGIILNKKLTDFDIATNLLTTNIFDAIVGICAKNKSKIIVYKNFGVVKIFYKKNLTIDISTFRKEAYITVSYPKILFIDSPKIDSKRRDFTINSLYISPKNREVSDFNNGLSDLGRQLIKFIGRPEKRILEDPFRMVRALRFALELKFKIEKKSWHAIKKLFKQKKLGSILKLQREISKLKNKNGRALLKNIIYGKMTLDKVEDKFYYKESKQGNTQKIKRNSPPKADPPLAENKIVQTTHSWHKAKNTRRVELRNAESKFILRFRETSPMAKKKKVVKKKKVAKRKKRA